MAVRIDAASRRMAILEEAERLIGQRGYHGFGLQELADRCSLTKAGLLHHFPSKDQLLTTLLRDRDGQNEVAAVERFREPGRQPSPALRRQGFIDAMVFVSRRNAERPALTRLHVMLRVEAMSADHPAHAYFQTRDAAKHLIVAESLEGLCDDPIAVARRILATMSGLEQSWIRSDCGFDLAGEFAAALTLLLPPIGGATPTTHSYMTDTISREIA